MVKRLSVFFLLIGFAGAVLFFPFNMNNRYTCLYHRLFCETDPVYSGHGPILGPQPLNHAAMPYQAMHGPQENALIPHYLKHFAFYWWGSLLLAGICLLLFRKKNRGSAVPDSNHGKENLSHADENSMTDYPLKTMSQS